MTIPIARDGADLDDRAGEDVQAILEREVVLLRAGKLSEAKELDLTTDPINRQAEQFEQRYGLAPCP